MTIDSAYRNICLSCPLVECVHVDTKQKRSLCPIPEKLTRPDETTGAYLSRAELAEMFCLSYTQVGHRLRPHYHRIPGIFRPYRRELLFPRSQLHMIRMIIEEADF
jgi:hypothetical protein